MERGLPVTHPGAEVEGPPAFPQLAEEIRAPAAAGVAGLIFAALFVTSIVLLYRHPAAGSSAQEIAAWYLRDNVRKLAIVGLYLAPFSGIAFLWFVAVIRSRVGAREDKFLATVFLGSAILFVGMMFAAAAAGGASLIAVKFTGAPPPTPEVVVFARALAYTFLYVYATRAAAVFMIVASTIALRTATFPRPVGFLGYALALVLLFSVSYFRGVVLIFPAWVSLLSIVVLWTRLTHKNRVGTTVAARG